MIKRRKQAGFSLIELVMVTLILAMISVVLGHIFFQGYKTFLTSQNITDADWHGFVALERMTDEIRSIRSQNSISTATASQLTFTDMGGNSISYTLSGTSLQRNSAILASGVTGMTLSYLDKNGASTSTATAIRYVQISLTLAQSTISTTFATTSAVRGMQ